MMLPSPCTAMRLLQRVQRSGPLESPAYQCGTGAAGTGDLCHPRMHLKLIGQILGWPGSRAVMMQAAPSAIQNPAAGIVFQR